MWGFCEFLTFILLFFFASFWQEWGLFSVILSWVKGSHHFEAMEVAKSRFDNLAKCHICLYAYIWFYFVSYLNWLVSVLLSVLRYFNSSTQGRQSKAHHFQKVAIGLHMPFSYLRSPLFILFFKDLWQEGWGLGFCKFCNGSPPFSKVRKVELKIDTLGLHAHICLFFYFGFHQNRSTWFLRRLGFRVFLIWFLSLLFYLICDLHLITLGF